MEYQLVVVKVGYRENTAAKVQSILTSFGCNIKVRLGLHDLPEGACSPEGLIVLQVTASEDELKKILSELNGLGDVAAKSLSI